MTRRNQMKTLAIVLAMVSAVGSAWLIDLARIDAVPAAWSGIRRGMTLQELDQLLDPTGGTTRELQLRPANYRYAGNHWDLDAYFGHSGMLERAEATYVGDAWFRHRRVILKQREHVWDH